MFWKIFAIAGTAFMASCSTMRAAPVSVLALSNCDVSSIVNADNYKYLGGKDINCPNVIGQNNGDGRSHDEADDAVSISSEVSAFGDAGTRAREERNAHISTRIAAADIRFRTFTDRLVAQKNISALSAAIGAIAFSTASGLTTSKGVKENWAAASALLAGTTSGFDNAAFAKQAVDALVSAMRAKRGEVLARIFERMKTSLGDYSRLQAMHDLEEYEAAGTVIAALSFLADAARRQEKKNVTSIDSLMLSTYEQSRIRKCLTSSVGSASRQQLSDAMDRLDIQSDDRRLGDQALARMLITDVEHTPSRDLLQLAIDFEDAGLQRCYQPVRTSR